MTKEYAAGIKPQRETVGTLTSAERPSPQQLSQPKQARLPDILIVAVR